MRLFPSLHLHELAVVAVQVFVAGATGRLGCRVVLELLRNKKLKVRAGARNPEEARNLVKAATDYGLLTGEQARRLTVVPVDLEDEDSIAPAVGNAGRVSIHALAALHLSKLTSFETARCFVCEIIKLARYQAVHVPCLCGVQYALAAFCTASPPFSMLISARENILADHSHSVRHCINVVCCVLRCLENGLITCNVVSGQQYSRSLACK